MNTSLFDQATRKYRSGDYRGALRGYTACLQDTSVPFSKGEVGLIYHRIGNCLMKLNNFPDAIKAYDQALDDPAYEAKGSLENNIGMAYASLREYGKAADAFKAAIDDPDYDTPYKAYMGLGNAELKMGHSAEAGIAFREAALDEENPDPAKALLNLGICFMALDRPEDAILSYESALQFDTNEDTVNRLNASMGQAYVADGRMKEAVEAFEAATASGKYTLSDSASVDYQKATQEVARMKQAEESGLSASDAELAGKTQVLGSGMTVQATSVMSSMDGENADTSGLDVQVTDGYINSGQGYEEDYAEEASYPGYIGAYDNSENNFFETSDEELEKLSKKMAKKDRKKRNVGLKVLITIIVILILLFGAAVVLYIQGFGFPTQQIVVEQLFADPESAQEEGILIDGISSSTVRTITDSVIPSNDVEIDAIEAGSTESIVYATVPTEKGGEITYRITMLRDLIGWKVSNVELYFPSLG